MCIRPNFLTGVYLGEGILFVLMLWNNNAVLTHWYGAPGIVFFYAGCSSVNFFWRSSQVRSCCHKL